MSRGGVKKRGRHGARWAVLLPCFVLAALSIFSGCGARDWDVKLCNGYWIGSPYSGLVVIASNGPTSVECMRPGESVARYWNDDRWIAAQLEGESRQAAPLDRFILIDTRNGTVQRYADLAQLELALPPDVRPLNMRQAVNPNGSRLLIIAIAVVALTGLLFLALLTLLIWRLTRGTDRRASRAPSNPRSNE